jgi:hypothetical protein
MQGRNISGIPPIFDSGDYMIQASYYDDKNENKFLQGFKLYINMINLVMGGGSRIIGG